MSASADQTASASMVEHELTEGEVDKRATSDTPFFKLSIKAKGKKSNLCYFGTDKDGLLYPPEREQGNQAAQFHIVKLSKESGSDQYGYVISSPVLQDAYLQVTEQSLGSKKRTVKFTSPKQMEPLMFHQSQLFKRHKDPRSEAQFAFYTAVVDKKGHNKLYYLKPESGAIVAEESSSPDGYHYFSIIHAILLEPKSKQKEEESPPASAEDLMKWIPIGHVPYSPSLPGIMGTQPQFQIEWWYFGGWAKDAENSKTFTILLDPGRDFKFIGSILYGIGVKTHSGDSSVFVTDFQLGEGKFPPPTSTSWSIAVDSDQARMSCNLTAGTLGLPGATYQVTMRGTSGSGSVAMFLSLKSTIGLVPEVPMEFAMPAMTILEGSTITIDGKTTQLAEGNIWFDRQAINSTAAGKSLYIGNWLAVTMNDGTSYALVFYWPKRDEPGTQWMVGTEVGYPPTNQVGFEYPTLKDWNHESPAQGTNVLKKEEFDLNILSPDHPGASPHWKSQAYNTGNTYCTAWNLKLKGKVYKMMAVVRGTEVKGVFSYFSEGAAILYDNDTVVGHVFVEQMGYN